MITRYPSRRGLWLASASCWLVALAILLALVAGCGAAETGASPTPRVLPDLDSLQARAEAHEAYRAQILAMAGAAYCERACPVGYARGRIADWPPDCECSRPTLAVRIARAP